MLAADLNAAAELYRPTDSTATNAFEFLMPELEMRTFI